MDEIQKYIAEAPLTEQEKNELAAGLQSITDEKVMADIATLLKEKPWIIPVLSVNLAAKKKAFAAQDETMFSKIIAEEITVLETLAGENTPTTTQS